MTSSEIRQLHDPQEIADAFYFLPAFAFSATPPLPDEETAIARIKNRHANVLHFALYEGQEAVSIAAGTPMTQNVRGKIFPVSGIFNVATHPKARRKGYVRQLMTELLAASRKAGHVFSTLYPFRESFYERMGYVTFPEPPKILFKTPVLQPLLKKELGGGSVEMMKISQGYKLFRQYMAAWQPKVHGLSLFDHPDIPDPKRNEAWMVVVRIEGQLAGMMIYKMMGEQVTKLKLCATRFYYNDIRARYLLLEWIARHIDQASEVELWLPAFEQPNTWLSDLDLEYDKAWLSPMGRVLDLAKIGGLQTGPGLVRAHITDPFCPWNQGNWQFETVGGQLQVTSIDNANFELSIQGLSGLVYGCNDPASFPARGWGNPDAAQQTALRQIFPAQTPHLHEYF